MLLSELKLSFGRLRTRALLIGLCAIPSLLVLAVKLSGGPESGDGPTFLSQVSHNGVFAALAGLTVVIPFFLPLAVSVVAGDTIAGEASLGTLRYLLTRPVSRTRLLVAKLVSASVFCLAAASAVVVTGLVLGSIVFPIGDVTTLSGSSISLGDGIVRAVAAAGIVGASMMGLAAIGLFISTLTDSPVGAIAACAGVAITSQILDAIPQLHAIHPFLLTHHWLSFGDVMRSPVAWGNIGENLLLQVGWAAVFGLAAWARMTTKDVLG
ncbi:MAG TPA: ABC transporter permease subunit [Acidimicrobiales bacterium]|nr:ABC transporter permease subunit [Acidimicrobiales bacterium]